jgi:hypothetical protein
VPECSGQLVEGGKVISFVFASGGELADNTNDRYINMDYML